MRQMAGQMSTLGRDRYSPVRHSPNWAIGTLYQSRHKSGLVCIGGRSGTSTGRQVGWCSCRYRHRLLWCRERERNALLDTILPSLGRHTSCRAKLVRCQVRRNGERTKDRSILQGWRPRRRRRVPQVRRSISSQLISYCESASLVAKKAQP